MKLTPAQVGTVTAIETHALIGALLVVLVALYAPGNLLWLTVALVGLLAVEVWKEYSFDVSSEAGQTYLSGTFDLLEYYLGAGIAWVALFLTHRPV